MTTFFHALNGPYFFLPFHNNAVFFQAIRIDNKKKKHIAFSFLPSIVVDSTPLSRCRPSKKTFNPIMRHVLFFLLVINSHKNRNIDV
jgi:hypothetical protein